jgi:hypothetical protein
MTSSRELDYPERLQEYIDRNGNCAEKYFLFGKIRAPFPANFTSFIFFSLANNPTNTSIFYWLIHKFTIMKQCSIFRDLHCILAFFADCPLRSLLPI